MCAEIGIQVLYDKSLIYLSENKILMHDLIQEMGWNIIPSEFPDNPEKWSRLWDLNDVCCAFMMKKVISKLKNLFKLYRDMKICAISFLSKLHIYTILASFSLLCLFNPLLLCALKMLRQYSWTCLDQNNCNLVLRFLQR